jgi:hypothetical protein
MRRHIAIALLGFLLILPVHAQEGYPLPAELPPITPENVAQLTQLASVAGELPGPLNPIAKRVFFTGDTLRGYDLQTGAVFFEQPVGEGVTSAQFSADGSRFFTALTPLVYGGDDPFVLDVWEIANVDNPVETIEISNLGSEFLFSPDGKFLSLLNTACGDGGGGDLQLWDAQTGKILAGFRAPDECGPYAHLFTPDGKYWIGVWGAVINIIDLSAAVAQPEPVMGRRAGSMDTVLLYRSAVRQVEVSLDGKLLAVSLAGTPNPSIDIVALQDVLNPGKSVSMPTDKTIHIANVEWSEFSPDGDYVLTQAGLWDARTGELLNETTSTIGAFSPDSALLATAGTDGLELWDVSQLADGGSTPLATFDVQGIQELIFTPDGRTLYLQRDGDILIWGVLTATD